MLIFTRETFSYAIDAACRLYYDGIRLRFITDTILLITIRHYACRHEPLPTLRFAGRYDTLPPAADDTPLRHCHYFRPSITTSRCRHFMMLAALPRHAITLMMPPMRYR